MKMKLTWALLSCVLLLGVLIIAGCTQQNNPTNTGQTGGANEQQGQTQIEAKTYPVAIEGFAFNPAEVDVNVGDAVLWTNKDSAPHTVVSDSGNEISSPSLATGQTYSHTFTQAGAFDYHCSVHPSMKAKVVVS